MCDKVRYPANDGQPSPKHSAEEDRRMKRLIDRRFRVAIVELPGRHARGLAHKTARMAQVRQSRIADRAAEPARVTPNT
jgi:hypothetical protein